MTANPIGIVIMAIAALIGILYVLYTHFEEVQEFCASVWESPAAAVIAFITGPIGMLIYCVAGIIANWETVREWFSLLWENPSAAIEQFVSFLQSKLGEGITWAQEKWEALREVLSHPIDAVVNFIRGGDSAASDAAGVDISENAIGGIYKKGAFLTTFAENSPEAAIPIDGSTRAVRLWKQTGEMMGLLPKETAEIIPQATAIQGSTAQAQPPMLRLVPPLPPAAQEVAPRATAMQENAAKAQPPMLMLVPPINQTIQNATPQLEASAPIMQMQAPTPIQNPTVAAMPPPSGGVNITFNPIIHIDGTADAGVVEQLRAELERQKQELIAMFPTLLKRQDAHERRLSYA